jgi:hypothetical protein
MGEVHSGAYRDLKKITFKQFAEEWLNSYAKTKTKPSTLRSYQNIKYIQHQLGHASIQTTLDRYGHLLNEVNTEQAKKLDTILGFVEQSGNSSVSVRRLLEDDKNKGVSNSLTPQNHW